MVCEEIIQDRNLIKHWSDQNVLIHQVETGIDYPEAIDVIPCPYTYTETDIPIEPEPEEEVEEG